MADFNLPPPPLNTSIVEIAKGPGITQGAMTRAFHSWLQSVVNRVQATSYAPPASPPVNLESQNASIGLTSLLASASGLYRVHWRFRVRTAATTSSSLLVTVTTTEGAVTVNQASAAYTGNAVDAPQSGTFIVRADASAPIQYATTYASVGATAMLYDLDLFLESLGA